MSICVHLCPSVSICVYPWFIEDIWNQRSSDGVINRRNGCSAAIALKRDDYGQVIITSAKLDCCFTKPRCYMQEGREKI
ncbi:MAG: hypothetical protein PHE01_10200 [Methanosarcina sp.]|nr:hypothetical protein [Methanosarcina sp.]